MRRGSRMGLLLVALTGMASCKDAVGFNTPAWDRPTRVSAAPDSIHVGQEARVTASGCPPLTGCWDPTIADLRWWVGPADIVVYSGAEWGQVIRVRGLRPGVGWVVAAGRAGADSVAVTVIP